MIKYPMWCWRIVYRWSMKSDSLTLTSGCFVTFLPGAAALESAWSEKELFVDDCTVLLVKATNRTKNSMPDQPILRFKLVKPTFQSVTIRLIIIHASFSPNIWMNRAKLGQFYFYAVTLRTKSLCQSGQNQIFKVTFHNATLATWASFVTNYELYELTL